MRRRWSAAWGPKRRQRVLALDPVLVEELGPALRRSRSPRSARSGPGRSRSRGGRAAPAAAAGRAPRSAPGVTRPGSRGKLIRPRQPEAITESSGTSPPCASVDLRRASASSVTAPSARRPRVAVRTVRAADGVVARDLGQAGAEVGERVVVALFDGDRALRVAGRADQVLERLPVAVAEGLPLRLAVVGEHDQAVGARRLGAGGGDPGDLAVEVAQHGERVVRARSRSGGRPRRRRGRSCRSTGRPARTSPTTAATWRSRWTTVPQARTSGVGAAAGDPRADVVADLAAGRAALAADVGEGEDERAGDRVGTGEVGRVVAADRPAAVQRRAHRQHRVRRVAGEDVGAAGAVGVQQPAPVRVPPLQLFGVARVVGDDRRAAVLLPPAEGRHVLVGAVQQARPGRRRSARTSRSPSCCSRWEPPRSQAARLGALPSASARCRTSWARPSISRKRTPGTSLSHRLLAPPRLPPHDVAVPGVVFVDREQRVDDRGERRHRDRDHDPLEHAVDVGARAGGRSRR